MNVIIDKSLNEAMNNVFEEPTGSTRSLLRVVDMLSFLFGVPSEEISIKISHNDETMINEPHEGDLLITTIKDEFGDPENALLKAEPIQEDPEQLGWYRLW